MQTELALIGRPGRPSRQRHDLQIDILIVYGLARSLGSEHMYSSETVRTAYDTRGCFNVRSKADISQLNLPHETKN